MAKLIPPDKKRCQSVITKGSFMTLGPRPEVRCDGVPVAIATEKNPPMGSMSLCAVCLPICKRQIRGQATYKMLKARQGEGS